MNPRRHGNERAARMQPARLFFLSAMLLLAAAVVAGCGSALPNRDPTGEPFPSVVGESLAREPVELPQSLLGEPAVLLIGYEQEAQFDIDRWVLGLLQSGTGARILELPTIPALVPTVASGWIDEGMRSGIPEEDWGIVVTLYGSGAGAVAEMTGTENGRLARVVVLGPQGEVAWFDDSGYAPRKVLEMTGLLEQLGGQPRSASDVRQLSLPPAID
jgi:hypothetical protein